MFCEPALLGGGVRTLMNISLLTASHCQLWPLCCRPIRQTREEIPGRHLPQVIIEVPVTQQPLHTTIHSAEEAVSRPHKQESAIKSCTRNNKSYVGDEERRMDGSPQRLACRANVTWPTLLGTTLSTDRSHEILHIATYSVAVTASNDR